MKRDLKKIFAEYDNNGKGQAPDKYILTSEFLQLLKYAEETTTEQEAEYTIHAHPCYYAFLAFKFGYVCAMRDAKRKARKEKKALSA